MKLTSINQFGRRLAVSWLSVVSLLSLALNASASVLVANSDFRGTQNILRYDDRTGTFIDVFIPDARASTIAFGPDGNLYLSNGNRYDAKTGALIGQFFPGGDFVFGPGGNLYVEVGGSGGFGCTVILCSSGGIQRYDGASGEFIDTFISAIPGSSHGGITFGPDGSLYVASLGPGPTGAILRYDVTTGALLDTFVDPFRIFPQHGMMFGPDGKLYVATELSSILRFDPTTGGFDLVSGGQESQAVAFGPDGNLYVGNAGTGGCGIFRTDLESGSVSLFAGCTDGSPLRNTFALAFTPVPLPSSLILVAVGIIVTAVWRKSQRRSAHRE